VHKKALSHIIISMGSRDLYYGVITLFWLANIILFPDHFIALAQFILDAAHAVALWIAGQTS
jgi:hypothetical protein